MKGLIIINEKCIKFLMNIVNIRDEFHYLVVHLRNEFNFWKGHGIMNTSGLLQSSEARLLSCQATFMRRGFPSPHKGCLTAKVKGLTIKLSSNLYAERVSLSA